MKTILKDFPGVLLENDKAYFATLEGVINTIDELSTLEIRKGIREYIFRISISSPSYLTPLIKELNSLHNMFSIRVQFSKSIKTSSSISYKIFL